MDNDPIIEVLGKTGKPKKVHLSDIELREKIVRNYKNNKFEAYLTRWYKLPGEYINEYDAYEALMNFIKKYYIGRK